MSSIQKIREAIFTADDLPKEELVVEEWGGVTLLIRGMNGRDRSALVKKCIDTKTRQVSTDKLYPLLLIGTVFDPGTGDPVFREEDLDAINLKSGKVLETVGKVASRLSGLEEDENEEMGKD